MHHREIVDEARRQKQISWIGKPLSVIKTLLRADIADIIGMTHVENVDVEMSIFQLGFTSLDVVRLKHRLDSRLGTTVGTIALMKRPTVRSLAGALDKSKAVPLDDTPPDVLPAFGGPEDSYVDQDQDVEAGSYLVVTETDYVPFVVLRSSRTKTPLWLVHPGVGEVLVFVGLAQHVSADDRPIYALRARGFQPGQSPFADINEAVTRNASSPSGS